MSFGFSVKNVSWSEERPVEISTLMMWVWRRGYNESFKNLKYETEAYVWRKYYCSDLVKEEKKHKLSGDNVKGHYKDKEASDFQDVYYNKADVW